MALHELEEEVRKTAQRFSENLGFINTDSMKEAAKQFKMFSSVDNEEEPNINDDISTSTHNDNDGDIISPSQKLHRSRCSMLASMVASSSLLEDEWQQQEEQFKSFSNVRKSRKSVCIAQTLVSTSEEENDDMGDGQGDSGDEDHEVFINFDRKLNEKEDNRNISSYSNNNKSDGASSSEEDGDIRYNPRVKKKINRVISSSDSASESSQQSVRKKIIISSGNEESESDHHVTELTKSFQKHSINIDEDTTTANYSGLLGSGTMNCIGQASGEDNDKQEVVEISEDESDGSLKDFIVPDGYDSATDNKNVIGNDNVFQTPNQNRTLRTHPVQNFLTPFPSTKRILNQVQTPKSVPGTPGYKRQFNKIRDSMVKDLFFLYNDSVFDCQLPKDLSITWNKRMIKTAGFCYYSRLGTKRSSRIELSDKVIDCSERLRDTLIHELCHTATWLINGVQDGHGKQWKYWAAKANKIHPDLPIVTRCHEYEINKKYIYKCDGCGNQFGRFSKSIKPDKHRCAKCGGIPQLLNENKFLPAQNPYAAFVKENFARTRKDNPGISHKDCMIKISEMYRSSKRDKENV